MADVGAGEIDFARIFARHRFAHYFVEHDQPGRSHCLHQGELRDDAPDSFGVALTLRQPVQTNAT
jgi:hypothetical protein